MSAVKSYISSLRKDAGALLAAAALPASVLSQEPSPSGNEISLDALKAPPAKIWAANSQGVLSIDPPVQFDKSIPAVSWPISGSRSLPSLNAMMSLTAPPTEEELLRTASLLRSKIENASIRSVIFGNRHPSPEGTMAAFDRSGWESNLERIRTEIGKSPAAALSERLVGMETGLDWFNAAIDKYDSAPALLREATVRLDAIEASLHRMDPDSPVRIRGNLESAGRELRRGNAAYYEILENARNSISNYEAQIGRAQAEERERARHNTIAALALGFALSAAAFCGGFGSDATVELCRAAARLLHPLKTGWRDRAAFFRNLRDVRRLSRGLAKEEPKLRLRLGRYLAVTSTVLSQQREKGAFAEFIRMISVEPVRSFHELRLLAADMTVRGEVVKMLWPGPDDKSNKRRERWFRKVATPDGPPCKMEEANGTVTEEARRYFTETAQAMRRGIQLHRGFSALTFEARTLPDLTPPLLSRFFFDTADLSNEASGSFRINCATPLEFPGPGIALSSPSRERLFGVPAQGQKAESVLSPFEKAWPWAREALRDVQRQEVIFSQMAFVATFLGDDPRYQIDGQRSSYVVFNDHRPGTRTYGAYLVPTAAVRKAFGGTLIPFADYVGPSPAFKSSPFKSSAEFLDFCRHTGTVVELTSNSNLGGSLSNGYPPGKPPYHEWEITRFDPTVLNPARDAWGHVHKSYFIGKYVDTWRDYLTELYLPFVKAHEEAFAVASRYQNNLDVLRLRYGDWKKGFLPRRYGSEFGTAQPERWSVDREDDGLISQNPGRFLMLDEIFHWHRGGHRANLPRERFPVLSLGKTFNYFEAPDKSLLLDSLNLALRFKGKELVPPLRAGVTVPLETRRRELERWWLELGLNELPLTVDLRLYHRESLRMR